MGFRSAARLTGILLVAFLSACATSHRVTVDSLARPDANAISYSIRNAHPTEVEDSARYREAAALVKTALAGRGLYEAPPKTVPDVIVDLDYGVNVRTQSRVISEPVWDNTPIVARIVERTVGGETTVERVREPTKFPTTVRNRTVTDTIYEKYIHLTARENHPAASGRPPNEIWTVDVASEGKSSDLGKHLPVLVAASIDYIGKDSHGQKTIRIKDTDADVAFVKKGL